MQLLEKNNVIIPKSNFIFEKDDLVVFLAKREELKAVESIFSRWCNLNLMNFKGISFYLSLFCFPISFLSFINILYASYFDYFLSIDTYFTTLLVSLILVLVFFIMEKIQKKTLIFLSN